MKLIVRGTTYYLRKRVPTRFKRVDPRVEVLQSLHTDSLVEAHRKGTLVWNELLLSWEARLAGDTDDAEARYAAARNLAQMRGVRYLAAPQVAKLPLEDLLTRVEAIPMIRSKPNRQEAEALLGAGGSPEITVTRALELFWGLAEDRIAGKSSDQIRRWRNPRIKSVKNFVDVIGDIPLKDITSDHMLDFREWWWEKIKDQELTANSGNKDITHLSNMFRTVNKMKRLGLDLPLGDLTFQQGEKRVRPPFSVDWITGKLLAKGALDGLNGEARAIFIGMINTGYRPSEGSELRAEHIRLDTTVPHISIEAVGRTLKSQSSKRVIPLTGVSLKAFQEFPEGFPRYRNTAGLSDTINKYLRENKLCETPDHTLYCLRHSFEDRMLAAGVDERIRRDLFGHSLNRERYGAGASLEHKLQILNQIAL